MIKAFKSQYWKGKKEYGLHKRVKCSGFYHYWDVLGKADFTGSTFFVKMSFRYCAKNGKDFYNNTQIGYRIKKHCKNAPEAKRFMIFMVNNPIDYIEDKPL
jgi:hypothetical protein